MSHYRIERLLGVGGMGMVYEARWLLPYGESMPVACKVMRDDRRYIPHYRELIRQEAATSMQLGHNHPNLVTVFNFFEDGQGRPCLAMELVRGGSVADLLGAYHWLPPTVVRRIAIKVLSALACLHDAQVLHRDLSPCNILVSTAGEVKVSDLNLVKIMEDGQAHTHTFRGKPVYASPEARENGPLDARSDLYSLGAVLYHLLTGKPPCGDERDPDRILALSKREAFAPLLESTPRDLAELTMGLLRSQPDARRPQSAHEALALLRRDGEPVAGRVDLGGLVTTAMQRRHGERRAGEMVRELEETFEARVARDAQRELDRRWNEARTELQRDLAAIERGKAELAEKQARLQALIRQATMQGIADGIRARRRSVAMGGMARERHVLVRIDGIEWVGSDGYVVFSVQNRRLTPYHLGEVTLRLGGLARTDAVSLPQPEDADESGAIGLIPPGDRHTGVIALRDAANWMGERVSLELTEHGVQESSTRGTITLSFWIHE